MTNESPINDDELKRLLQPLNDDAAPVDEQRMQEAVSAAADVFDQQTTTTPASGRRGASRSTPMTIMAKPLAVLATAAAVLVFALVQSPEQGSAAVTLGDILDETMQSPLQLAVARDGKEAQVWVRQGSVRWETSPQQYQIAAGSRLWKVDESKNDESATSAVSPWWMEKEERVDLLALLGAQTNDEIRRLKPAGIEQYHGRRCHVYEFTSGHLVVRAWADAETNALDTIAAWSDPQKVQTQPPLSELRLIKRNADIDESKFVVGKSLSVDGRTGRIIDQQGIVSLRPLTQSRWTPVYGPMLIRPGDWLRTDVRGANAATVELVSKYRVIVGPGSLVELAQPQTLVLHYGQVQIIGSSAAVERVQLIGPNDQTIAVAPDETVLYRLNQQRELTRVDEKPIWLAGYEGSSNEESIGTLIASVDGRDTPLTVGFHKVNVEIRDQIARTTIEESFVNHTNGRLEGIFHFPLPQDASISGFGMWINGELIEADVVEKQRAREIYETILRENRDPGLLEWTGGNIFKARVFPILPHSEKRIKIVYTQVLPLRAQKFRYSYGLKSELLQKNPLRELSINVLVNSALPLKSVDCPTHPARVQTTKHSGRIEFSAQEYTPDRDFEVVCELDTQQSDVVVVPHRRGDDGYFLAQVMPPSPAGRWQRDVLPDGQPLNLLLVCDTSGSMNSQHRETQQQFVASVLNSLGPDDRFNLAVCDVGCEWKFEESQTPSEESIAAAVDWLQQRRSLGWTDLDAMATSVVGRSDGNPHIIYIGDGIVTAGDADPQTFINRWKRLMGGRARLQPSRAAATDGSAGASPSQTSAAMFHAVSVGSSFESTVLNAIASVGGGSVRQVTGEQTPARVARELLNEIAQPGLRDLKVEFKGMQVAAVYPNTLPNLAAGTQQIIVGRYLPEGQDQTGQMLVTGRRNGEPVTYVSKITLKDAEHGNSFIPRLWARAHLDHLLQQGGGQFIQDQIIAMSEEFHIITPYTSLLVLETDADRERFGVKRRFLMRDGERFFADGRSSANFELVQQQMKIAGDWRLGMRMQILRSLAGLGRSLSRTQQMARDFSETRQLQRGQLNQRLAEVAGKKALVDWGYHAAEDEERDYRDGSDLGFPIDSLEQFGNDREFAKQLRELPGLQSAGERFRGDFGDEAPSALSAPLEAQMQEKLVAFERAAGSIRNELSAMGDFYVDDILGFQMRSKSSLRRLGNTILKDGRSSNQPWFAGGFYWRRGQPTVNDTGWMNQLFPQLPATPQPPLASQDPEWPEDVLAISRSLIQSLTLPETTGLRVRQALEGRDPRWDRQTARSVVTQLYRSDQWLAHSWAPAQHAVVNWCDETTRGAWSKSFGLGHTRKATSEDVANMSPGNRPFAVTPLHRSYSEYHVKLLPKVGDTVTLELTPNSGQGGTLTVLIDVTRHIVLRTEWKYDDGRGSATEYSDHVQLAGVWWPQTIRSSDVQGQVTQTTKQTVEDLSNEDFAIALEQYLPGPEVQLLSEPLPSYRDAKITTASGAADFDDHLVLMLDAFTTQDWDEALAQLENMDNVADGKPGVGWIRQAVLQAARRNEESRQLLHAIAERILDEHVADQAGEESRALALAGYLMNQPGQLGDANEQLRLLDELKPVFDGQRGADGPRLWKTHRAGLLQRLNRVDEVLPLRKDLAESAPWDVYAQRQYAEALFAAGEHEAARAWLRQQLDRPEERQEYERDQLRDSYADLLRREHRPDELIAFLTEWLQEEPTQDAPCRMYLAALILADRTEDADATAADWIAGGQVAEEHRPAHRSKVLAAVSYALGEYHNLSSNRFDPKWLDPLLKAARFWLSHDHHFDLVTRVLNHHRFSDSDQADLFRAEIAAQLLESAPELSVTRLSAYIGWTQSTNEWSTEQWTQLAGILRQRWQVEQEQAVRRQLGDQLTLLCAGHAADSYLPFLRARLQRERDEQQSAFAAMAVQRLFIALIGRPWSIDDETEALSLLPQLSSHESSTARLVVQIEHLHRFVDAMLQLREVAATNALQAEEHPEELTRTQLAERQATIRKEAIQGVMASLETAMGNLPSIADELPQGEQVPGTLRNWFAVERMYLELKLDRNHAAIADECWELIEALAVNPETPDEDGDVTAEQIAAMHLAGQLKQRALTMITYLAVQKSAPEGLRDRLRSFISERITESDDTDTSWQSNMIRLLIALDEPEELERLLRDWIRGDDYPVAWQLMLARLLAEQGTLDQAITLFEAVQRRQQLSPADQSLLADWYMATDRRDEYRRSRIETFKVMQEYQLQNWIGRKRQPWYQTSVPLPTELDEDVLFAFQALFEKSSQPGQYVYELNNFYTACRDFRLLRMIPDSVIGRTPQQVYSFLTGLENNLLGELRNEATADEILKRTAELRASSRRIGRVSEPNAPASGRGSNVRGQHEPAAAAVGLQHRLTDIDRRALDLIEAMIERRSSEVLNQPGPHATRAVAALRRAFNHEWAEGEIRQMGDLLGQMGTISVIRLAAERLQQLQALHNMTEPGTDDRVFLAQRFGHVLFFNHNRREDGIAVQSAAIREYEQFHPNGWPAHLNEPLWQHAGLLESAGRFAAAETLFVRHIAAPANASQRDQLKQRRDETLLNALRSRGQVSLGQGRELFRNLLAHLRREAASGTDSYRYQVLNLIPQVFRTAKDRNIPFQQELTTYAFEQFSELLDSRQNNYGSLVSSLAQTLHDLTDPKTALEFLVTRMEQYPARFEVQWQNAWQQHAYNLGRWRKQANGSIAALEPRILALVLKELRRDLTTRQQANRVMYDIDQSYFWAQKAEDFAATAESVLRESSSVFSNDGIPAEQQPATTGKRTVVYVAQYLYDDLNRCDRAIEIMFVAHRRDLLDVSHQITLCQWLHWRNRHAESIPLLEPIVEAHPDVMSYRTLLITAYNRANRSQQRDELLGATDEHFRKPALWHEANIAALAGCCEENGLDERAVRYYDEVIPLHQRTQPNRGIGNGILTEYYRRQARAYSRLGRTKEAVDAASAAVVAWGPRHDQRRTAVNELRQILHDAKDLDKFAAFVDADAEKTGMDSPLIRKQLGIVYRDKNEHQKAVKHLQKALLLQPHDLETHQTLLECYDAQEDQSAAVGQLLAMIDIDRHNLELYLRLADRLKDDPALSERAVTSLVEAGSTEAESHQALAELRQKQNRWQDAIQHWQHVARLRSLEPTGLVNLAKAQLHEKDWPAARNTLQKLSGKEWPGRFSNLQNEIQQLQNQLTK